MWTVIAVATMPVSAVAAWLLSSHFPDLARQLTRFAVGFAALAWGALVATGLMRQPGDATALTHY